jgi:hypothetical protein
LPTGPSAVDDAVAEVDVTELRHRAKRARVLFGVAAALILVVTLTVVMLSRRTDETSIDTSRDPAIAEAALLPVGGLGSGWEVSHAFDEFTMRVLAEVAAKVPECAPYVDYAFDSPRRDAATSVKRYQSPSLATLWDVVYIFPSKDAASLAMDKIAEAGFPTCFAQYLEAATPKISPGATSRSDLVDTPPLLEHGDRQIAFTTRNTYPTLGDPIVLTSVNVFIQVDRAIVYVNPVPDFHDSTDANGLLEKAMTLATESLRKALEEGG